MCKYRFEGEKSKIGVKTICKNECLSQRCLDPCSPRRCIVPPAQMLWETSYLEMVVQISAEQMKTPGQILLDLVVII